MHPGVCIDSVWPRPVHAAIRIQRHANACNAWSTWGTTVPEGRHPPLPERPSSEILGVAEGMPRPCPADDPGRRSGSGRGRSPCPRQRGRTLGPLECARPGRTASLHPAPPHAPPEGKPPLPLFRSELGAEGELSLQAIVEQIGLQRLHLCRHRLMAAGSIVCYPNSPRSCRRAAIRFWMSACTAMRCVWSRAWKSVRS